ncbi:MAG: tandem-95 repeat protein, partial [Deltaproteobacteria bacterium]
GSVDVLANDSDPDGDPLTAAITTPPVAGMASISGGVVTYYPVANYHGEDAVGYTVSDGHGNTASATLHVAINSINDPPSAQHDFITVAEDGRLAFDPTANDSDVDGDALAVTGITPPSHGTATLDGNVVTYVPDPDYVGDDYLEYTITDGHDEFSTASIFVTVTGNNDAPVAVDDQITTAEDTSGGVFVLGNDTDPDGDSLSVVGFTQPAHGSATLVAGFATYTPGPDFNGTDAFSYTVADPTGASSTATVHVTVTPVNDAPVAADDSASTDEDTPVAIDALANDSDVDGDALAIASVTAPAHGTAAIVAGQILYTPAANYHGADAFRYTVADPGGATATATVTVAIASVNDLPIAVADAANVDEDAAVTIDVVANDSDADGDALAVIAITQPAHGSATIADATHVTYTPAANYNGPDAFSYTISDGHGGEASAGVAIAVSPVNDAPVAVDDGAALDEDTSITLDVVANDGDVDGDALAITSVTQPAHGVAEIVDATHVAYTPAANYHGADAFSYTIGDGHGGASTAQVAIAINPVNDAPVAVTDAVSLLEDTTATIDVVANDSDVDGDALAITAITQPAHGSATIVDATHVAYTPAPNYHGGDAFSYAITDPSGAQATALVAIDVVGVNDAPVAAVDAVITDEDTPVTVDVVANDSDIDGDALAITSVTQPAHGAATVVDAHHITYAPAANYNGPDAFSYTISDGNGGQASAAIAVVVNPVNDAPVAVADAASTDEDTAVTVDVVANDSDVDGDALAIASITQPAHGAATIVDPHHVQYTPAPNYHGADGFSYTIADPSGAQATAAVVLDVASVNDAPVAADDAASTDEDSPVTVDVVANDSDVDGDALAIASITQPAHGSAAIADGHHVTYTPAANYNGADSFSYTIDDGHGAQATAAVALAIAPVNDAPVAAADAASTDEDTSITVDVVANDADIDGDALAITSLTPPAHGAAFAVDGHRVLYVPAANYHGPDALSYTISDGNGGQATAQLVLDVVSVNDAPVAVADAASLDEDTSATIDVVANDSDVDGDHQVSYTPAANYNGADSFSYTIDDGHGAQATATVAITIAPVNDPPVAADDAAATDEDTQLAIDVAANDSDVDGDTLTVASVTQPAHGTAAIADGHHVTYTPAANYNGSDAFQYTIGDGNGAQATATVAIAIAAVNDPPVAAAGVVSTFDDTPATATLAASDVDGDAVTLAIATPPAHGTLGPIAGNHVTYTPAAGFAGSDVFTFTASDGQASSAPAAILVTVVRSVCGNGVREGVHEECDDGNAAPGDGCEANCRLTCGSGTGADRATVDAASGHCFAAFDGVQHSYQEAAAMCAALGGHLPTITSESEDDAAFAAVRAGDTPWLGADDIAVEGAFHWTTGEPLGYSNFDPGKPDNAGNADCVQYLADGAWSDAGCSGAGGVAGTLCELELAAATPAFATGGGGTKAVAVADVNGDGYGDVAAINPANNTVGILLGNGAGGFVLQATYATGNGPAAVATGDFDRDGHPDLAVLNATANTVSILRGSASGAFTAGATVAVASGSTSLAVADFDQDGVLDLAVAASATVRLLHGNGAGGFTAAGSLAITGVPASIAAGDFDHDGKVDLVLTTPLAVLVVMGTGGGLFGLPVTLAVSTGNRGIAVADLDGDGNLDLAIANGAATVSVFFGGAGGFGAPTSLTVAGTPLAVVAGDFDGDGATDLVALTGGTATLFHRTGRTFTPAGPIVATGGSGATAAAVINANADAAADLVVANATSATAGLVLGGAGGLAGARALPAGTGSTSSVSGDFNQDGRADLAIVDPAANAVFVFVQTPAGTLVPSATITLVSGGNATYILTADFNSDGKLDLLVVNTSFQSVSVLLGAGNGTFGAPLNTGTAQSPRRPALGDFDGDGRLDVAVPSATGNVVSILSNTGSGRFGRSDVAVGTAPSAVVVGDFNGDGKKDMAVAFTGEADVKLLIGHGDSTFSAAAVFPVVAAGQAIAAGDFDGDGKLDVAVTNTSTATVSLLRGTGTGSFAAATTVAVGSQPAALAAVDLDGDTRTDLVVGGSSDITVLHNSGTAFVASSFGVGAPVSWVCVADLDRDGHLDVTASTSAPFVTTLYSAR